MCTIYDPKQSQIDIYIDPRQPSIPQIFITSMWAEVDVVKQELFLSQPSPRYDVSARRTSARSEGSPPQQTCFVSRVHGKRHDELTIGGPA